MNKLEFAQKVVEIIESKTDKEIEIKSIQKNNITKLGIIVKDKYKSYAPTFYVDDFMDKSVEIMANTILNFKCNNMNEDIVSSAKNIMNDNDEIFKRLTMKLLNKEKNINSDALSYDLGNGLIAQFIIVLNEEMSVTIKQDFADNKGFTKEQLFKIAKENLTNEIDIVNMAKFLSKNADIGFPFPVLPIYIITNKRKMYGASCVYAKGLKDILTTYIGDFYLLPSSIHEMIAVPKDDIESYKDMVQSVNSSVLSDEDYLSDNIYDLISDGNLQIA